jgi:hypothetical protein
MLVECNFTEAEMSLQQNAIAATNRSISNQKHNYGSITLMLFSLSCFKIANS